MSDQVIAKPHWSFWLLGAITLLWNVMGAINFIVQFNTEIVAAYRESERVIIADRPVWATAAFALAVFGGALGSLLLLLKKRFAYPVFIVSLLGVIVSMIHALSSGINFGVDELVGILLMPLAVAAFLIGYAKYAERKGWLR